MANDIVPLINVSNVDKSLEWYKGLGFKTSRVSDGGMDWGTVEGANGLVVFPKDGVVTEPQPADTRAWVSGDLGKGVLLTIRVANAERVWKKAQEMRVDVDMPLTEQPWGGKGFMVVDPDGYVVNVTDKFPGTGVRRAKSAARKVAKTVKGRATRGKVGKKR